VAISSRRRLRVAASTIAIVAVIGGTPAGGIATNADRSPPYCKTVRDLIDYTQQKTIDLNNQLEAIGPSVERDWPEPIVSQYPVLIQYRSNSDASPDWAQGIVDWATVLQAKADQVKQQDVHDKLGGEAQELASDSAEIVLIKVMPDQDRRPDNNPAPDKDPPEWMQQYNYFAAKIDLDIDVLNMQCPA
jgi:hypothetical protein